MAKRNCMTRNQDHDDLSGRKRIKTCDDVAPWSDLNYDVLLSIMMQLGVVDFLAFSGVCKSWRSLSLSNKMMFMASKPPMKTYISTHANKTECYLVDFQGRKFKTSLLHFRDPRSILVGITCGYLILYGRETKEFLLVNPITRHELYFPPVSDTYNGTTFSGILVFSPSLSKWVFIMSYTPNQIWFSIAGEGTWNHLSSTLHIHDLHVFKGKIYTLQSGIPSSEVRRLCEMKLNPKPEFALLETKNFPTLEYYHFPKFCNWGENLYLVDTIPLADSYTIYELDLGEMKWVPLEETIDEYAFLLVLVCMVLLLNESRGLIFGGHNVIDMMILIIEEEEEEEEGEEEEERAGS